MMFPTPHVIEVRDRVQGQTDAFGNEVVGWSTWRSLSVMGWAQVISSEPKTVGTDRVVIDLEIYSPTTVAASSQLRFPDGKVGEVVGEPMDCNRGPWDYQPGYVLRCRYVNG